ncbi:MAG TPA: hypothetical protein VH297_06970 [Gaiellaceae bacterium]
MRLKFLVTTVVVALATTSAAFAGGGHHGKRHKPKAGSHCRQAWVVLAGSLAADVDPQDGDSSFALTVKHSNRRGRAFRKAGTATILVDAKTRVRRKGEKNLGALAPNDRVLVLAKACRADLKDGGTPDLTARQVRARPAAAAPEPSS